MSKMRVVALAGAVGCAVIAGIMAKSVLNRKPDVQQQVINKVETVDVLVATKDLQMGEKVGEALNWRPWPKDNLLTTMITRDAKPEAQKDFAQARARQTLYKDEPLVDKRLIVPGVGGFMAANLPKGMRAKSVAISSKSAAGGFILPNDRVDVILTRKFGDPKSPLPVVKSETVVSNVRVMAINQLYKQVVEGEPAAVEHGETATLELPEVIAEAMASIESSGEVSLALRSIAESDGLSPEQNQPVLAERFLQ